MKIVIAATKSWNIKNAKALSDRLAECEISVIERKDELSAEYLTGIDPDYIFFPHWSWIIPPEIYENFTCVVFHMTDLPYGRGGSPLQNLLVRGIYKTKISAIRVDGGLDTGDVYFKEDFDISSGSADNILSRASDIIFHKMIPRFLESEPMPSPQTGEAVSFKRRTPGQSEIPDGLSQRQIYDYIRMLDGEGYPTAYRKYDKGRIYYTDARFENDVVTATARFVEDAD